jgi:hypothetical protein
MGRAKEIIVKVIPSKVANEFVKQNHYSGKVAPNSKLHFGAFLDNKLHGVLSFGSPLDKSKVLGLVKDTLWNEMLELNRMAFDEYLPKYSESRCLAICFKLIKRNAPHIKWVLSFSDGVLCGDGTIYRASGFQLTQINDKTENWELPNKQVVQACTLRQSGYTSWLLPFITKQKFDEIRNGSTSSKRIMDFIGAKKLQGNQLRYIYLIDKTCKITVPIIPFSKIDEMGAGMYKGKKITLAERQHAAVAHLGEQLTTSQEGAFDATLPLNNSRKKLVL